MMLIPRNAVDVHVHLNGSSGLETVAAAGIVAVRNAGAVMHEGRAAAREPSSSVLLVVDSLRGLYKAGGYGARFGTPVHSCRDIPAEIAALKKAGAGIIKVMASGMVSLKNPGAITAGGFDEEELRFIVTTAAGQGLPVMAHANGEQAIGAAAAAGVRSIEHGFFMTEQALEILARNGVFWVPTTAALARATDGARTTQEAREFVSKLIQGHLEMVRLAHSFGVPLGVGTDCILPDPNYRQAYEAELGYFGEASLPVDEVVKAATVNGMRLLGN